MREMKDSGIEWIGEIPKNKHIIRNKYLLEYAKGKLPTDTNFEGTGFPYIGATDLDSNEPCKTYTCDESLPDSCDSDLLVCGMEQEQDCVVLTKSAKSLPQ